MDTNYITKYMENKIIEKEKLYEIFGPDSVQLNNFHEDNKKNIKYEIPEFTISEEMSKIQPIIMIAKRGDGNVRYSNNKKII